MVMDCISYTVKTKRIIEMGFRANHFEYDGNVKFNLQLRQSRAGKSYLYATFEGDSSSISVTFLES